uniref:NADH:ubiquinone oxidoreductase intermediate-associated protein 30 domain-containing protein n=1 Tax=Cacopsylla melanoneura TaxID=428564 RepID=A0A8D8UXU7_9HEMI
MNKFLPKNLFGVVFLLCRFHWSTSAAAMSNTPSSNHSDGLVLFDFTKLPHLDNWTEESDTVREVGKSKAVFTLQKTRLFQRGIFFTLLNPQDNGAGFAGARTNVQLNLSQYDKLVLYGRAQGSNAGYKVVLRHNGLNDEPNPTYEQIFQAKPTEDLRTFELPLSEFKPFFRGRPVSDAPPLNKANITRVGLQVFGGVYMDYKQKGASSLEIDWIKAV